MIPELFDSIYSRPITDENGVTGEDDHTTLLNGAQAGEEGKCVDKPDERPKERLTLDLRVETLL